MTVNFRGYLFNDAGTAVSGATVALLETGTTTQEASTTTDSNGLWYFTESDQDRYDVKLSFGSSVRYIRWDDQISLKELDVRNNTGATTPAATFSNLTNSTANQVAVFSGANTTRADGDVIYMSYKLANAAGELTEFARMIVEAEDTHDGSEDGAIQFQIMKDGSLATVWEIKSTGDGDVNAPTMSFDLNMNSLTIGAGADTDITLTFDANSADGVITWMEDEDYFQFSDDILMSTTERINLRDTAIYIYSSADGQLDLVADTEIQIAATTIDINGAVALNGAITGATNITLSGELDAATLDISGNSDFDGTLDVAGNTTISAGTFTVGSDGSGQDVIFYSGTSGDNLTWDSSEEVLQITGTNGATALDVLDGDVRVVDKIYLYDRGGEYLSSDGSTLTITGTTTLSGATTVSGGLTSTAASNTLGTTSFNDTNITNVDDIALDSISADGTDINIAVSDNSATALTIKQGSDAYLIVDTANSSESVSIGTGISGTAITIGHGTSETTIADNLTVTGDLTINGTTTTVNSTTTTVDDPIFTLGGDTAPGSDDNKDRGIEFRYYDSQARIGFFGYDDSAGVFTGFTAASNSSEVFSGTVIGATFGALAASTGTFSGILKTDDTTEATSTTDGSLQTDGGLSVAKDAVFGDDVKLLSDSAVLTFGADSDTTITHTDGTGLTLNSTNKLTFGDTGTFIHQSSDGVLTIESDTTVDINGAVAMNGAVTGATNITLSGELDAATLDISGNADIDGTTNLDAVDIDGNVQLDGTLTVGVDNTGYQVKFFGESAGAFMLYDDTNDTLEIRGPSADSTASTGKLLLSTALTDINANDVLGKIEFKAPDEAGGTDAITVAASIQAVAQGTFSASVNATDLIFSTGHSEAATEKFRFTSQGEIGIGGAHYGTDGQVLTSGGAGAAPSWADTSAGGTVSLVADGSIPAGAPTFITSAGKAKHMVRMMADNEVPWPSGAQGNANNVAIAYGTTDNRGIILYHTTSGGDELGQVKGWTVVDDGNGTITHGTATQFCSQDSSEYKCWYDDSVNKFFIAYRDRDDSNKGKVMTATVGSDLAITLGGLAEGADNPTSGTIADVTFEGGAFGKNENGLNVAVAYSTTDDAGVIVYADGDDSNKGKAVVVTCPSGTAPTVSSEFEWNGNGVEACDVVWDPDTNKFIIAYEDGNGLGYYIGRIDSGAVVQAGPAIGSGLIDETGVMTRIAIGYDTTADKVIISYRDTGSPYEVYTIAGAVSSAADSGMSITFGTKVQSGVVAASVSNGAVHVIHDPATDRNIVFASDNHSTGYIEMHIFTISGTALTLVDTIDVYNESGTNTNKMLRQGDALLDPDTGLVHLIHRHDGGSNYPYHIIMSPLADDGGGMGSVTGVGEYIGLNTTAVTDGNTATITTPGGLNENQTGLTVASQYFIGRTGKVSTVSGEHMVGLATASTKMLVLNFDPRGSV